MRSGACAPPAARSSLVELLLDVLAAPDPERAVAWRVDLPEPRRTLVGDYRVGVWLDDPFCATDREVLAILRAAADSLADAGAKVNEAHPPVSFAEHVDLFRKLVTAAVSPSMPDGVAEAASGTHRDWLRADEQRARLWRIWQEWLETYDALVCPVMPAPAFPHDQEGDPFTRTVVIDGCPNPYMSLLSWTGLISVLGLPSTVAPVGRTWAGMPAGCPGRLGIPPRPGVDPPGRHPGAGRGQRQRAAARVLAQAGDPVRGGGERILEALLQGVTGARQGHHAHLTQLARLAVQLVR